MNRTQFGQAATEYLIVVTTAVIVLFVPLFDGRSVAGAVANAVRDLYATLTYLLALA